jgi:hypothetical protein
MDDVVVKTKQSGTLLDDLKETFTNLRRYRMKLNLEKCTFGVPARQLLEDKSHQGPRAAHQAQRCAEVCWLLGLAQPICQPARRKGDAAVSADEEDGPFCLVPAR